MNTATLIYETSWDKVYSLSPPIQLDPKCAARNKNRTEAQYVVLVNYLTPLKINAYIPYEDVILGILSGEKPDNIWAMGWPTGKELNAESYEEALEMLGYSLKPYVPPPIVEYGIYDEVLL